MQNLAIGGLEASFASSWQKSESNSFAVLQTLPWKCFEEKEKVGYKPSWKEDMFTDELHKNYFKRAFQAASFLHSVIQNISPFLNLLFIGKFGILHV